MVAFFPMDAHGMTMDPLTAKGEEIMKSMKQEYGEKKGESVFYASRNSGTITGVDDLTESLTANVQRMTQMKDPLEPGKAVAPANAFALEDCK